MRTFCTFSRRPAGPLAPPPRRARLRSRWRSRYGGASAGRLARKPKIPGAAVTGSSPVSRGGFDKGTLAAAPIGLKAGRPKGSPIADKRTSRRPLSNPPLCRCGTDTPPPLRRRPFAARRSLGGSGIEQSAVKCVTNGAVSCDEGHRSVDVYLRCMAPSLWRQGTRSKLHGKPSDQARCSRGA